MRQHIDKGVIPQISKQQSQLYRQLGAFAEFMHRPKNQIEIQKDRRKSVPQSQVPMVF